LFHEFAHELFFVHLWALDDVFFLNKICLEYFSCTSNGISIKFKNGIYERRSGVYYRYLCINRRIYLKASFQWHKSIFSGSSCYTPAQQSCKGGILESAYPSSCPSVFSCPPNNLRFLRPLVFIFGMEVSHD
jgi:hypothetical protein